MSTGTLILIPVPLGPQAPEHVLPPPVLARVRPLVHFVVENAKSARAILKAIGTDHPLQQLHLAELNEHTPAARLEDLLTPLCSGHDLGLLSEAGCPAVADPGANLVALAQSRGIRVQPLIGPSSLLLALMASGLNGQRFAFHGYLSAKDGERQKELKELESESRSRGQTQIFIETPYRNRQLFDAMIRSCRPATRITVATELSLPGEVIRTHTVAAWRAQPSPDLDRRPTVFLMLA